VFNIRSDHPKERPGGRSRLSVAAHGFSKKAGEVFLLPDDPGMPRNEGMRADGLRADPDDHLIALDLQNRLSPGVSVGHRVAVAKIGDVRFPRDLPVFLAPEEVGRDRRYGFQVLLVQAIERDLVRRPMGCGVDPVAPLQELPVHVVEGGEGSSEEEVAFHVADGIFNLSFGLRAVGFAEPGKEPMMREEVLERRVPLVITGAERPFEDHRFDVVIQDLLGIPAEVVEGVEVALDEGGGIRGEGEDHVPHPGIAEDHAETVQFPPPSIDIQIAALAPIDLRLDTGFGLIPEDCRYTMVRSNRPDIILDDGVLPGKSLFLDLAIDSGSTQGIVSNTVLDVVLIGIEFARFTGSWLSQGRCPGSKVFAYGLAIKPSRLGDLTDVQPLIVEIADH